MVASTRPPAWVRAELKRRRQTIAINARFRCEVCGRACLTGQVAHLHPLGAGRSREDLDAECSNCGMPLNEEANLAWTCSLECNHEAANRWRLDVGCRRDFS